MGFYRRATFIIVSSFLIFLCIASCCHVKSSADLAIESGGSCTTCLINECGTSFQDCLSTATTTVDAENCMANTSVLCRETCYVHCVLKGTESNTNYPTEAPINRTAVPTPETITPRTTPPTEAPVTPMTIPPTEAPTTTAGGGK